MINETTKAIFGKKLHHRYKLSDVLSMLHDMKLLNIGELGEKGLSIASGVEQCPPCTPNIDLVSGVQIKSATTTQTDPATQKAYISISNTTATILAVVTESVTKKQYFFRFPRSSYKDLNGNTLSILFDQRGFPKPSCKWWYYQVKDYETLAEHARQGK